MGATNSVPADRLLQTYKSNGEDKDYDEFKVREAEVMKKIKEIRKDQSREQFELRGKLDLLQLNMCLMDHKKSLKEINELVTKERVQLTLMCEKSNVQKKQEVLKLKLQYHRDLENLLLRRLDMRKEGKQAVVSEALIATEGEQEVDKTALKSVENELVGAYKFLCDLMEEETTLSKQFDAITALLDSRDKDTAISTISSYVSRSTEMPADGSVNERANEIRTLVEVADAALTSYEKYRFDLDLKRHKLEATLNRERDLHKIKLQDLKTETFKSKKTLKEMGEIVKRETANLERILRKKELEINQDKAALQRQLIHQAEIMWAPQIILIKEVEVFYGEKYGGGNEEDEMELQKLLLNQQDQKEKLQKWQQLVQKNLRVFDEEEEATNKELDTLNNQIESHYKGKSLSTLFQNSVVRPHTNLNPNPFIVRCGSTNRPCFDSRYSPFHFCHRQRALCTSNIVIVAAIRASKGCIYRRGS